MIPPRLRFVPEFRRLSPGITLIVSRGIERASIPWMLLAEPHERRKSTGERPPGGDRGRSEEPADDMRKVKSMTRGNTQSDLVTVVGVACNESEQAADWVGHLAWADRVVVVDTGSSDDTPEILRAGGAEVECLGQSGPVMIHHARNVGHARVREGLMLDLDLDERVSLPLQEEIRALAARPRSPARPRAPAPAPPATPGSRAGTAAGSCTERRLEVARPAAGPTASSRLPWSKPSWHRRPPSRAQAVFRTSASERRERIDADRGPGTGRGSCGLLERLGRLSRQQIG